MVRALFSRCGAVWRCGGEAGCGGVFVSGRLVQNKWGRGILTRSLGLSLGRNLTGQECHSGRLLALS